MTRYDAEALALKFFVYTIVVFTAMLAVGLATGGAGSQEPFEYFRAPADYAPALNSAGGSLRLVLFLDVLFMIGYGGGLAMMAYAHVGRAPVFAWVAGLGVALLLLLDIGENVVMAVSLDMVRAGVGIGADRIGAQAAISAAKWSVAALTIVSLSFALPRGTWLELLLVWSARVALPLGTGLFVTDAFAMREVGGLLILAGMGGGFVLLALTIWLRLQRGNGEVHSE